MISVHDCVMTSSQACGKTHEIHMLDTLDMGQLLSEKSFSDSKTLVYLHQIMH